MGKLFSINEIFTVNSPFLFTNSLVPSSGSISQYFFHTFLVSQLTKLSSVRMGIFFSISINLFLMRLLELMSASVIGELSAFKSTLKFFLYIFNISLPASMAIFKISKTTSVLFKFIFC